MQQFMPIALHITAEASEIPRKYFRASFDIDQKSDSSPVTVADRETEQFIRNALAQQFPGHDIFGEEFGRRTTDSEYEWVIDPIDGTRSFVTGMPLYGMLLALLKKGLPLLSIVRMPELDEVYYGDGSSATRNGNTPLRCSTVENLDDAIVYINEGEKINQYDQKLFKRLCSSGRVMRLGYDCYPHMLVASGYADLVIDFDLKPYDYLSLIPIIEGAGGVISDWKGDTLNMNSVGQVISAATTALQQQALALINA